jgi:hypothetical protein
MIFGSDLAKKQSFMPGRWLVEPSLNGRIMWADIKEKVNDVKRTDCPPLISTVISTHHFAV